MPPRGHQGYQGQGLKLVKADTIFKVLDLGHKPEETGIPNLNTVTCINSKVHVRPTFAHRHTEKQTDRPQLTDSTL